MKYLPILLCYFSCMNSCEPGQQSLIPEVRQVLNIIIYDQSQSADYIALDTTELRRLIAQDAASSKVWLVGLRVLNEKSVQQQPVFSGPYQLHQLVEEGSIYQLPKIKRHNETISDTFTISIDRTLATFQKEILDTHDLKNSDIKGVLQLAERIARQDRFADMTIRLIVLSDLLHDLPDKEKLTAFSFPSSTVIYPIGHHPTVELEILFPNNTISPLAGFKSDFFLTL